MRDEPINTGTGRQHWADDDDLEEDDPRYHWTGSTTTVINGHAGPVNTGTGDQINYQDSRGRWRTR